MKYISFFLFFLIFFSLHADIQLEKKALIDNFINKYTHNLGILTRVEIKLQDLDTASYSEETQELVNYFKNEVGYYKNLLQEREKNEMTLSQVQKTDIRALYYSAYASSRTSKIDDIIDIAKNTEINALVIDIKEIDGKTSFEFNAQDFTTIIPVSNGRITDISSILKRLKEHDIYTIARIVVFKDEYLANTRPDLAIKWSWDTSKVWGDYKGNSYTDPGSQEVWDYHVELASAAYSLGFDEINLDYVRYPSDGYISQTYYPKSGETLKKYPKWGKMRTMDKFSEYINRRLQELHPNIIVSADIFGLVTNVNLFQIGQNLESYILYFDYVAPMIYPSHYSRGYLGNSIPDNAPYEIFYHSLSTEKTRIDTLNEKIIHAQNGTGTFLIEGVFETAAPVEDLSEVSYNKIRPWLQGFSCSWCPGASAYTRPKFRKQIHAIEELGFTSGWYVWNASARYVKSWYNK